MTDGLQDALRMACVTDPGMVREHNEDCIGSAPEIGLAVLADGMGGSNAGEVASGMLVASLVGGLPQSWTADRLNGLDREQAKALSHTLLQAAVKKANAAIHAKAQDNPDCEGMGTTLVACLFHDDFLTVAHVGDSRLYRIRNDLIEQVTSDHSLLQEQLDSGMITRENAHLSKNKNFVTRAVGVDPDVEAEIHSYDVLPEDIFLLCSDGLHGMIDDEEIEMTVAALGANLDLAAQQLVGAANDAGGRDNVSVILVQITKSFAVAKAG